MEGACSIAPMRNLVAATVLPIMKNNLALFLCAALLGLTLIGATQNGAASAKKAWQTDFAKASAEAKKKGQILLVDFNATWCGPCQMYKKEVFPTKAFKVATKDVVLVDIDTDKQPALAEKFKVSGIPDIRILSPEGKELGKLVGFGGPEPLLEALAKAKKEIGKN